MQEKYLFAFDLDETALPAHYEISPGLADAVAEAQAAGHAVMIATARPMAATRWVWETLGLSLPCCLCNGALVATPDEVIAKRMLPAELVHDVAADVLRRYPDARVWIESGDDFYANVMPRGGYFKMLADMGESHLYTPDSVPAVEAGRVGVYFRDPAVRDDFAQYCRQTLGLSTVCHEFSGGQFRCAFWQNGVNKWVGIGEVAARCGIPPRRIITFGDSWNDEEMLRLAGRGYAMAGSKATAYTPYATRLPCAEGGLGDMILRIVRGEEKWACAEG